MRIEWRSRLTVDCGDPQSGARYRESGLMCDRWAGPNLARCREAGVRFSDEKLEDTYLRRANRFISR